MLLQPSGGFSTELSLSLHSSSPCKPLPPFNSTLFRGFNNLALSNFHKSTKNRHAQNKSLSKDAVLLGFKLQCHSKIVSLPNKDVNNKGKKKYKNYGSDLSWLLWTLDTDKDFEKTLDSYLGTLTPKEQTLILKEQSKWYKVLRVFEWFKSHEDYVPNLIHYNVVLRALGKAKKWDELRLCWVEMAKKGIFPTNHTYSILVDVYGKAGLVKEALLWIKHMKLRGIFPDEVTMSTVLKVLKDAEEYDRAVKFYKDWSVGKIDLDDLDLDSMGDQQAISFKQFHEFQEQGELYLYGKAGRLKDASNVFSDMLKAGVALDAYTFNTMIYICGRRGDLSEAEALLNRMEEKGVLPDTKTHNIFISLYANVGNIDAALKWYRKIREVGLFPDVDTHRAVINILAERNMVQEIEDVIEEMEKLGKRVEESCLPVLTKLYVSAGNCERAKLWIEKFKSYGGISAKNSAAIIDVYAENGLWAEAEAFFYSNRDGCERKDVLEYNVMIKAYGKAEVYDKALLLFRGMRNQGTWPDKCTYNSLIQMLAGGDLVDKARDILAEMQEAGFKPDCSTFSAVIHGFTKEKRLTDAVDVFEEMLRVDVEPNVAVYGSLIDAFAEDGKIEKAEHYFQVMVDSGISPNQIVLTSMIKAYSIVKCVEGAKHIYEKMKQLVGGPDIAASNCVLQMYGVLGMFSEAKILYDDLIKKNRADGVTYATMIYVYKNLDMLQEALEIATEMKRSGFVTDCDAYNKVMACYAKNGLLVECCELLNEMMAKHKLLPDVGTFRVLFAVLKKGGFPGEAIKQLELSCEENRPFAKQAVIVYAFSTVGLHAYALKSCRGFTKENVFAYNAAIRAYTAQGKTDGAMNVFMRMRDEGVEPDIVTHFNLVSCYEKAGMLEGVKRIHSQLKYGDIERDELLYKAVVNAYESLNRRDLAKVASQEMKSVSHGRAFSDSETETEDYDEDYDEDDDEDYDEYDNEDYDEDDDEDDDEEDDEDYDEDYDETSTAQ